MSMLTKISSGYHEPHQMWPLLVTLDPDSISNLRFAIWHNHRQSLKKILSKPNEIMRFDAATEMVRKSRSSREARK